MSLLRAFIAVEIPAELRQRVGQTTASLREEIGALVRWVPPENMHLTLKFLGDVAPSNVEMLSQMLRAEAGLLPCFDIHVGGLGSFPSLKRPRVLYVGIQAPASLEALQRGVESGARRLGYETEERGFSPHLTIGRLRQNATGTDQQTIRRALERTTIDSLGTARVDSVHLYKSDLKPSGSVYTRLFTAPLKNFSR
ncbi:MAG TPA: RNA 2',3'-cyclic phosphodiesterase [Anaerolineales bacterium]|nr:RNA 2',3'-cyclic phosphodiesterase [Anaerolineales bacterium]